MKRIRFSKSSIKSVPQTPGIYKYYNTKGKIIYIGKAINLRSRMYSYTLNNLHGKTKDLISHTCTFSYVLVDSEIEALLLEAKMIGFHKPKYNISLRDDKKPLCIRITNDKYPVVITARNRDHKNNDYAFFGPFPSSYSVNSILRLLRRIFPYAQHKIAKGACLYNQLGLCNPCPSNIEKLEGALKTQQTTIYKNNIKRIKLVLEGKFPSVERSLQKQMKTYSDDLEYEMADSVKRQLMHLQYLTQPTTQISAYLKDPNFLEDTRARQIKHLTEILRDSQTHHKGEIKRIECYDVAHLAGTSPTASMVTFIDGKPDKKYYRHFKLTTGGNDTGSMKEVIGRRRKHFKSWGKPDLIIVDGGKPQVRVFVEELQKDGIPVVGIAKRFENLIIPHGDKMYEVIKLTPPALYVVQRLRDEAHRFARRYHHHLVRKSLLS
ncbi:GIY-YIG nuclease family protein [Patescibacteria group bacterium]